MVRFLETAKYLFFVFNSLIALYGIFLIDFGVIVIVETQKEYDGHIDFSVEEFFIAVGAITFMITFFGCCGIIKENICILTTYSIVLIVLLVIHAAIGVLFATSVHGLEIIENTFGHKPYSGDKTLHILIGIVIGFALIEIFCVILVWRVENRLNTYPK